MAEAEEVSLQIYVHKLPNRNYSSVVQRKTFFFSARRHQKILKMSPAEFLDSVIIFGAQEHEVASNKLFSQRQLVAVLGL